MKDSFIIVYTDKSTGQFYNDITFESPEKWLAHKLEYYDEEIILINAIPVDSKKCKYLFSLIDRVNYI